MSETKINRSSIFVQSLIVFIILISIFGIVSKFANPQTTKVEASVPSIEESKKMKEKELKKLEEESKKIELQKQITTKEKEILDLQTQKENLGNPKV